MYRKSQSRFSRCINCHLLAFIVSTYLAVFEHIIGRLRISPVRKGLFYITMPYCSAPACSNRTDKVKNNVPTDASFHRFPIENSELLRQWLANVGRDDFVPTKHSRLCSAHFTPGCFEEDRYAKYAIRPSHIKKGRRLKCDAVPSIFAHQVPATTTTRAHSRDSDRQTGRVVSQVEVSVQKPKATATMTRAEVEREELRIQQQADVHDDPYEEPELVIVAHQGSEVEASVQEVEKSKAVATVAAAEEEREEQRIVQLPLLEDPYEEPELMIISHQGIEEERPAKRLKRSRSKTDATMQKELFKEPQPVKTFGQGRQPDIPALYGTPRRTALDHPYSTKRLRTIGTQTDVIEEPKTVEPVAELSSPLTSPFKSDSGEAVLTDVEYLPSSDSSTSEELSGPFVDPCETQKYIVFFEQLNELHKFCKECGSPVTSSSHFTKGSMIGYRVSCHSGHSYVWNAQPIVQKQPLGNLLVASAVITSGNTYAKLRSFADLLKLCFISKSVYNKVQRTKILPVIQEVWEKERSKALEDMKSKGAVVLSGDGRCDSPGHTAKYGSYTLMNTDGDGKIGNRKIVSLKLVQVSEVKNSNHMEPEGLKRCLEEVVEGGLDVSVLATDQHLMIGSMMKNTYKEIDHQFDTWHLAKSVVKKLTAKAKQKQCSELSGWIQSISNHLWWSSATCGGNKQVLREMWMSVLQHVRNKHEWSGNKKFHCCGHPALSEEDKKKTKWLKPESPAFVALKSVVGNLRLLKSLDHLTKFCHTGDLEVYHSMLLKYCPKRQHFQYDAMSGRLMLSAIDWNNSYRQQKTDQYGNPVTSVDFSKRRKAFVLKNRYESCKSTHMSEIINRIYVVHRDQLDLPAMDRPAGLPKNVAGVEKPSKELLQRKFRSRFKMP